MAHGQAISPTFRRAGVSALLLLSLAGQGRAGESIRVADGAVPYRTAVRVQVFSENAVTIPCPVNRLPIRFLIADGAPVKKGQVITEFDDTESRFQLTSLERQRDVVVAKLATRLAQIDNTERDMRDRLEGLNDNLAVLRAQLARLRSLPLPDDVHIAEGRARVARLNAEAARAEAARAEDRFARGMIARLELARHQRQRLEAEAQLRFAEAKLEYARLPAAKSSLRDVQLRIDNATLEHAKLARELAEYAQMATLQKEGAAAQKRIIDRRIAVHRADMEKTVVRAPLAGYIMHQTAGRRRGGSVKLGVGARLWKNYNYLKIPDLETLALRGVVTETVRPHLNVGDRAEVRMNGRAGQIVHARLKSISTLSHDLAEKEELDWGAVGRELGFKVFDVVFALDGQYDWLRPGMHGQADVTAAAPLSGPVVPARLLRQRNGRWFLARNGVYEPVTGVLADGMFVLDDTAWLGQTIDFDGRFPAVDGRVPARDDRFHVSGELLPRRSTEVSVDEVGHWPWPKVSWLIAEESRVEKGQVVARLDPEENQRRTVQQQTQLEAADSQRAEAAKQLELTRRDGEFKQQVAANRLEIARLKRRATIDGRDVPQLLRAQLDLNLARVRLDDLSARIAAHEAKKTAVLAPIELARLRRDRQRAALDLEAAQIRRDQLAAGAEAVARSRENLACTQQEARLASVRRKAAYETLKATHELRLAELELQRRQRRMDRLKRQLANHTIRAPAAGLILYNKIWNSGAISKVNVGSMVGSRFILLRIPNLSDMYVRVEVPERYYGCVRDGMTVTVRTADNGEATLNGEVDAVEFLFENREKKDTQRGLYSSREPLGEVVFHVRIRVAAGDRGLKPGAAAEVFFPFATDGGAG